MALTLPPATKRILEQYESSTEPAVDYEIAGRLLGIHQAEGLTSDERKGAWAEAIAFNLRLMDESPWQTRYGPISTATKQDGTPYIAEIDEEVINHWEQRSAATQHPLLRARYADVTWDLKKSGHWPAAQRSVGAARNRCIPRRSCSQAVQRTDHFRRGRVPTRPGHSAHN